MRGFVFAPAHNTRWDKHQSILGNIAVSVGDRGAPRTDWNTAAATHTNDAVSFQTGATNFRNLNNIGARVFLFDNYADERVVRRQVFDALSASESGLEVVAYFGHGWRGGLGSCHISVDQLHRFSALLRSKLARDAKIIFYGCSTAAAGGFAQRLQAALDDTGVTVFGHNITGRYWMMNNLVRYPGGDLIPSRVDDGGPARTFWSRFWKRGRGAAAPWTP